MAHILKIETEAVFQRPQAASPRWLARIDAAIFMIAAIPAALLVLAEIAVLLAGIIGRYVFHSPIIWSDELAGILFLWLAMLGSVLAFQRNEHMPMTAVVSMLGPGARAFLDVVPVAASFAFLLFVIHPSYEFGADEGYVTAPALDLVIAGRAGVLLVGIGLLLVVDG